MRSVQRVRHSVFAKVECVRTWSATRTVESDYGARLLRTASRFGSVRGQPRVSNAGETSSRLVCANGRTVKAKSNISVGGTGKNNIEVRLYFRYVFSKNGNAGSPETPLYSQLHPETPTTVSRHTMYLFRAECVR